MEAIFLKMQSDSIYLLQIMKLFMLYQNCSQAGVSKRADHEWSARVADVYPPAGGLMEYALIWRSANAAAMYVR